MSDIKKVYAAINAVSKKVAEVGIGKDNAAKDYNGREMYKFRGIDDVYNLLAPIIAEEGLVIVPRVVARTVTEKLSSNNKILFYTAVEVEFDLVAAEDGSIHTAKVFGEAMDSGDKSTNKALSAAYKYLCFQVFCIPTEGDNDADATTHEVAEPVISEHQAADLQAMITEHSLDEKPLLNYYKIDSLENLPVRCLDHATKQIEKASKAKQAPVNNGGSE